jgi:hypothetical protein
MGGGTPDSVGDIYVPAFFRSATIIVWVPGAVALGLPPTVLWSLSGSENELTPQQCELMTIHRDNCTIYPTTDASTTEQRTSPTECPACDHTGITVENDLWRCTLCNASGLIRGERA